MFRALLLATILCLSFNLSGLAALYGDPGCSEDCPSDAYGGECAPNCQSCGCCSLPRTLGQPFLISCPVPGVATVRSDVAATVPDAPDPGDIFRVPKSVLA